MTRLALLGRLQALKRSGVIAGFEAPHPNRGLSGGMLPWVIMPHDGGPASLYESDNALAEAVSEMEAFGPRHSLSPAAFMSRN